MMHRRPKAADPVGHWRHRRIGGRPLAVALLAIAMLAAGWGRDAAAWAGNKNRGGGESSRRSESSDRDRDTGRGGQSDSGRSSSSNNGDSGSSSRDGGSASRGDNGGGDGGSTSRGDAGNGGGNSSGGNTSGDSGRSANRDDNGSRQDSNEGSGASRQGAGNSGSDGSGGRIAGRGTSGNASQDPPASMMEVFQRVQDWLQPKAPVPTSQQVDTGGDGGRAWKPAVRDTREEMRDKAEGTRQQQQVDAARGETGRGDSKRIDTNTRGDTGSGKADGARDVVRDNKKDGDGRKRREKDVVSADPIVAPPRAGREAEQRKDKAETPNAKVVRSAQALRPAPPPAPGEYVRGEVLVRNITPADIKALEQRGFKVKSTVPSNLLGAVTTLDVPPGLDATEALRSVNEAAPDAQGVHNRVHRPFKTQGGVAASPPRSVTSVGSGPCDSARCYGQGLVRWQPNLAACARGLAVGMLDTGVDHAHPAFARGRLNVGDFHRDGAPSAAAWHGTGVLALLAGDPDSGTPGLIPQSNFYVANVFYADESGQPATDTMSLIQALDWMDKFDVKVINLSLSGPRDPMVERMVEVLTGKGVVVLAAAGNEGPAAPPSYPAAYKEVIAVTAVDRDQRSYRYANRGSYIDIAAPGVDIWTAVPGAKAGLQSGTSFAVPFVTAAVAVMYKQSPDKSKAAILKQMGRLDLGQPGPDPIYGRGLLLAPSSCHSPNDQAPPAGDSDLLAEQPQLPSPGTSAPQPAFAPAATTGFSFQPAGADSSRRR